MILWNVAQSIQYTKRNSVYLSVCVSVCFNSSETATGTSIKLENYCLFDDATSNSLFKNFKPYKKFSSPFRLHAYTGSIMS